jgi:hypothetical protein
LTSGTLNRALTPKNSLTDHSTLNALKSSSIPVPCTQEYRSVKTAGNGDTLLTFVDYKTLDVLSAMDPIPDKITVNLHGAVKEIHAPTLLESPLQLEPLVHMNYKMTSLNVSTAKTCTKQTACAAPSGRTASIESGFKTNTKKYDSNMKTHEQSLSKRSAHPLQPTPLPPQVDAPNV